MQKDTVKTGINDWDVVANIAARKPAKCPECKGAGKLMKLWPLYAISMPNELAWQLFECWRCKGTGTLRNDDPYMGDRLPRLRPRALATILIWFWVYAACALTVIGMLLWP